MAGAWTLKKNSTPADPEEMKLKDNSPSSSFPSIFFAFHMHYNIPFISEVIKSISNLKYPFEKIHFWFQINPVQKQRSQTLLAPLLQKINNQRATFEFVETSAEISFMESRIESFKSAISSKRDLYFTTSSILKDPSVLRRLVNTGKRAVAPLLNEKMRNYRANMWLNVTAEGKYATSSYYHFFVTSHYNGLWAVPVILNTYLLKTEILPQLVVNLEKNKAQYNFGKLGNLFTDVAISSQITKQLVIPRLINQRSFGYFIPEYTYFLTDLFFKRKDPELWNQKYLLRDSTSLESSQCSKPNARLNSPLVYRCAAFNQNFVHDFDLESQIVIRYQEKVDTSSIKKNLFQSFYQDSCISKIDFVKKYQNLEENVFSIIARNDYFPETTSPVDYSVCQSFPSSCKTDLKPGNVMAKMAVCHKDSKVPSLLIRIELTEVHYLCHCMKPKEI